MWESPVSPASLTVGLLLLLLGGIPLLSGLGVIPFALPAFLSNLVTTLAVYILAAAGIFLLVDAWGEWGEHIGTISLVVGLVVIAVGIVHVLGVFGVMPQLIRLSAKAYNILFVAEGLLLFIGSWMQF